MIKILSVTLIILLLSHFSDASAESLPSREYMAKAAILYNFARFIEWPEDSFSGADDPFIISIIGKDPFGSALEIISKRKIMGRVIKVKRFPLFKEFEKSHIVFICQSEKKKLDYTLKKLHSRKSLTVSDIQGFANMGGMISLLIVNNKLSFKINIDMVEIAGLKISSKLLNLAVIISSDRVGKD
jgi:hypothetical protein